MTGKKIQITIPEKTIEILERLMVKRGLSKSVLVALAIEEYAKKEEYEKKR